MSTSRRLRAPLIAVSGLILAVATFAGPANAAPPYPPPSGTQVLGVSASAVVPAAVAEKSAVVPAAVAEKSAVVPAAVAEKSAVAGASELAFTGANAIGIGALGGLLLVGGATMVLTGRRRKSNA